MKKRYIKPVSSVIDLKEICHILAGSKPVSNNPNLEVGVDDWEEENAGASPAKRNTYSVWDESSSSVVDKTWK